MLNYAGRDRRTVNYLKTVYFDDPEWTPCSMGILPAAWMARREALEDIVLAHPKVFSNYRKGSVDFDFPKMGNPLYELGRHTDCWGTVWNNIERGFDSQVDVAPLADWTAFANWKKHLPDPFTDDQFGPRPPWEQFKRDLEREPQRIRDFYEVKATRVEPVGLVYLWPASN